MNAFNWLVCLVFLVGCTDDDRRSPDSSIDGGADDAPMFDAGGDDAGDTCTCGPGEGCLVFELSRSADDANLPWIAFEVGDADGMGTMVVGALNTVAFEEVARMEFPAQDLTNPSWNLTVDLGCVPATRLEARAFLDDDLDTMGGVTSSDFVDACLDGRRVEVTVGEAVTTRATGVIAQSCD